MTHISSTNRWVWWVQWVWVHRCCCALQGISARCQTAPFWQGLIPWSHSTALSTACIIYMVLPCVGITFKMYLTDSSLALSIHLHADTYNPYATLRKLCYEKLATKRQQMRHQTRQQRERRSQLKSQTRINSSPLLLPKPRDLILGAIQPRNLKLGMESSQTKRS